MFMKDFGFEYDLKRRAIQLTNINKCNPFKVFDRVCETQLQVGEKCQLNNMSVKFPVHHWK